MPEILKVFQFAQNDSMAEVQVRRRRVHAEFYAQRFAGGTGLFQLGAQIRLADDFR